MIVVARCARWASLLMLCLWPSGLVWAGGIFVPRPLTAAEKQAEQTQDRWRRRGLPAAPEMIEAVCRRDELLAPRAHEVLTALGPSALPSLARASARERCDLSGIIVDIVCASGAGESDLLAMLRDRNPRIVGTGLFVLSTIGSERKLSRCERAAPVVKRVTPELRPLLRSQTGQELRDVLNAAEGAGPDAASLVPDMIPFLDRDEVTGNFANSGVNPSWFCMSFSPKPPGGE